MTGPTTGEAASQIEYYARALRAPRISDAFRRLGDQARDAGWSHVEYLAAVLSKEVSEWEASGASLRIKAARFPGYKALEDFNFDHQPTADRNLIAHLGTSVFLTEGKATSRPRCGLRSGQVPARFSAPGSRARCANEFWLSGRVLSAVSR